MCLKGNGWFKSNKTQGGIKMKLGEIKLEALKLMFVNDGEILNMENLDEYLYGNEVYRGYLVNMVGSINRSLNRFKMKNIKPLDDKEYVKFTDDTPNDTEIDFIPDELQEIIPYFIKGELYQEDEPNVAGASMNYFESLLDDYLDNRPPTQKKVRIVYGWE